MEFAKPFQTLPNEGILGFAETYLEAGNLLYRQEIGNGFYLPATNLLCHAIELFLKSLINPGEFQEIDADGIYLHINYPTSGGHRLGDLFRKVTPCFKQPLLSKRANLCEELERLEGLFQATRYPFEHENIARVTQGHDGLAFSIANFLRDEVRELVRELPFRLIS
ncbi:hypothetical protein [Rhodobacter capsulatus]|uniref:hypothetical protein n=1 Tax=Rhodobacter capsulatus TaxID=1061 RepID=UPI004025CAD4